MTLTPARRWRLNLLADYLEALPADYAHFDMAHYVTAEGLSVVNYAVHNGGLPIDGCGTAACAVGHGPAAGILMPKHLAETMTGDRFCPKDKIAWERYASLFVGDEAGNAFMFDWLFASDWVFVDNGHLGAAARIRYLLAHGKPPTEFDDVGDEWLPLYAPYRIDAKALADA
jgi:hypothetical protein